MKRLDRLLPFVGKYHPATLSHCQSVAMHMFEWAACMNFSSKEMHRAYVCGMVHDIGNFCLPSDLLNKAGALSEREQDRFEMHPVYSAIMLKTMGLDTISPVVLYHHERFDGKGYPERIKEAEIPFLSRMIAVCDIFDQITNRQKGNWNMNSQQALLELKSRAGTQLDPWLCEKFAGYMHVIEERCAEYLS